MGVNGAQNTSSPLLGILTIPFAPFLGPVARGNLIMFVSLPLSATAAFLVLRKWEVWAPAAALAGLLYGFSPFMVAHGLAHLELAFLPLPPLIASVAVSIAVGSERPVRAGILLGLLLAAQFLISPEVFAIVIVVSAIVVACLAIRSPRHIVNKFSVVIRPAVVAAAVILVLVAFPVWMFAFGAQRYKGPPWPVGNPYFNDLLSFLQPGPLQRGIPGVGALSASVSRDLIETGSYIGIPLLLASVALAYRSRRSLRMQIATLTTIVAAILSLGPHLTVDGHHTRVPLPFDLIVRLPVLDSILAARFTFLIFLGLAATLAFGIDDIRHGRQSLRRGSHVSPEMGTNADRRRASVLCGLILVALIATLLPAWPYRSQPARALPLAAREAVPSGDPVAITYPYPWVYSNGDISDGGSTAEAEIWQMEANFSFRLTGGFALHPVVGGHVVDENQTNPPQLSDFLVLLQDQRRSILSPALLAPTRDALLREHVRLVIVDRSFVGSRLVLALFERVLGPPEVTAGSIAVWASKRSAL
jgi:hypothetical protein